MALYHTRKHHALVLYNWRIETSIKMIEPRLNIQIIFAVMASYLFNILLGSHRFRGNLRVVPYYIKQMLSRRFYK